MNTREKGITLIALVITIIILLILAGVSIATLTGENGLLTKANTAKTENAKKSAEEKVKIAVAGSFGENGGIDLNELNDNLRQVEGLTDILYNDTSIFANNKIEKLPIDVVVDGYVVEIDEKGKVTLKAIKPVVTYSLSTEESVAEGTTVTVTITASISGGEKITKITYGATVVTNQSTMTFDVTENGYYKVTVEASNGATAECIVKVTNIGNGEIFSDIYTETKTYTDANGNTARIPEGFAVGISNTINTINGGLVITDSIDENHKSTGNEFVWIPVGDIKDNNGNTKNIELNRYKFDTDGTFTKKGIDPISDCQELAKSSYGNTTAKDIEAYKTSVSNNNGYYMGRYEAGKPNDEDKANRELNIVCKKERDVYNNIKQPQSAIEARKMYPGSKNLDSVTSDLVNSYAWDTAIIFIQEFSGDIDYAWRRIQKFGTLYKTAEATIDGNNKDVRCNIYDMAGNCWEWSTESGSSNTYPKVYRGGVYDVTSYYPSYRSCNVDASFDYKKTTFRTLLYL